MSYAPESAMETMAMVDMNVGIIFVATDGMIDGMTVMIDGMIDEMIVMIDGMIDGIKLRTARNGITMQIDRAPLER